MRRKTIAAGILAVCAVASPAVYAYEQAEVEEIKINDSTADVTLKGQEGKSANAAITSYASDGRLLEAKILPINFTGNADVFTFEHSQNKSKLFIWNEDNSPLCNPIELGYTVTFVTDEYSSVTAYNTQDYTMGYENAKTVFARNSDTGMIDISGGGQVNFKVETDENHEVSEIKAYPSNYKNLKGPEDTGTENTYRITKITGDVTVEITTNEKKEQESGDGIIHLQGDTINAAGVDGVLINGSVITINSPGEYTLEGNLNDGYINVAAALKDDEVTLNLNGVNISSSSSSPILASSGNINIAAAKGTENVFTSKAADTAAIQVKNNLTIKGEGKINVFSNLGKGIHCKANLEIGMGDINVNAYDDGIKGNDSVKFTKKATNISVISSNGDGVKSDLLPSWDENGSYISGGTVTINGGNIDITALGADCDGIQADTLLTAAGGNITVNAAGKAMKANASSIEYLEDETAEQTPLDGDGCIVITGGVLNLTAGDDAVKAVKDVTVTGGEINISKAIDGLKSNEVIYDVDGETPLYWIEGSINIHGGTLNIVTEDDAVKCSQGAIDITGGNITIDAVGKGISGVGNVTVDGEDTYINIINSTEGIESKKILTVNDGTIIINASDDAMNSGLDLREAEGHIPAAERMNTLIINGGYIDVTSELDCLDSNASALFSGGIIKAASSKAKLVGNTSIIDTGISPITIKEGVTFVAAASSLENGDIAGNEQNTVYLYKDKDGRQGEQIIRLFDEEGNEIVSYEPRVKFGSVVITCPQLVMGNTYTITVGNQSETFIVQDRNTVIGTAALAEDEALYMEE